MRQSSVWQIVLFLLLALAIVLLIGTVVLFGLAELLAALGDAAGSAALKYVALASGGLLVTDLICLVLAQAVNSLAETDEPPDAK
jgi:hypothetical protein